MTKSDREIIYLYAGENHPKVKLTREREFTNVRGLLEYFHGIQDTFYVEFETSETITENLKLRCTSYGGDEFDGSVPFFILEYDEILDSFYVWKSEGQWELNKLIATLYTDHSNKGSHACGEILRESPEFAKHPRKKLIDLVIDKLNVDWSRIDIEEFWLQLDQVLALDQDAKLDEFSFKSLISVAVLKTKVKENKRMLQQAVVQYHRLMKSKEHTKIEREDEKRAVSPTDPECPGPMYAFGKINSQGDQVVANFNRHFKLMAEDYETFDLKNWGQITRKSNRRKPRGSHTKNCISKVKS